MSHTSFEKVIDCAASLILVSLFTKIESLSLSLYVLKPNRTVIIIMFERKIYVYDVKFDISR